MLAAVFRKEFRVQVRSAEFLLFLVSVTVLSGLTLTTAASACMEERRWTARVEESNRLRAGLAINWKDLGTTGYWLTPETAGCAPFRERPRLSRHLVRLRTNAPPEQIDSLMRLLTALASPVSGLDLMVFWAGLLALLMGTPAVAAEKQGRTLGMVWAVAPGRSVWWLAQWSGRLLPLWAGWAGAFGVGLGLAGLWVPGFLSDLRIGATMRDFWVGGLYLTAWLTIGMAVSSWTRRVDVAVLGGVLTWVGLNIVLPWGWHLVSAAVARPMSPSEFFLEQYTVRARLLKAAEEQQAEIARRWIGQALERQGDRPALRQLQEEAERALLEIRRKTQQEWLQAVQALEEQYAARFRRYRAWVQWAGWFSPAHALFLATGGPTGQAPGADRQTLWDRWREWDALIAQKVQEEGAITYAFEGADPFAPVRPDPRVLPRLTMPAPDASEAGWGFLPVLIQTFIAMAISFLGVVRYDPR
jgi:hypothetical protein